MGIDIVMGCQSDSDPTIDELFKGEERINYDKFLIAAINKKKMLNESNLSKAFNLLDAD